MEQAAMSVNLVIVNIISPYIGLFLCTYIMFNKRFCTQRKATSTLIIMLALVWLGLIWNDVVSDVYMPSRQSILSRALFVAAMFALVFDLAGSTKKIRYLSKKLENYERS